MLKIPMKGCKPTIDGALDITLLERIVMHIKESASFLRVLCGENLVPRQVSPMHGTKSQSGNGIARAHAAPPACA
jgi:hypothetical protein